LRQKSGKPTTIKFREAEKLLLSYLEENESISQSKLRRLAGLSSQQSGKILVDFMMLGLIQSEHMQTRVVYRLTPGYQHILEKSDRISYI
jgi:predicted HTH transcriptional regulator